MPYVREVHDDTGPGNAIGWIVALIVLILAILLVYWLFASGTFATWFGGGGTNININTPASPGAPGGSGGSGGAGGGGGAGGAGGGVPSTTTTP